LKKIDDFLKPNNKKYKEVITLLYINQKLELTAAILYECPEHGLNH
jgi:hypothetical protein